MGERTAEYYKRRQLLSQPTGSTSRLVPRPCQLKGALNQSRATSFGFDAEQDAVSVMLPRTAHGNELRETPSSHELKCPVLSDRMTFTRVPVGTAAL